MILSADQREQYDKVVRLNLACVCVCVCVGSQSVKHCVLIRRFLCSAGGARIDTLVLCGLRFWLVEDDLGLALRCERDKLAAITSELCFAISGNSNSNNNRSATAASAREAKKLTNHN